MEIERNVKPNSDILYSFQKVTQFYYITWNNSSNNHTDVKMQFYFITYCFTTT